MIKIDAGLPLMSEKEWILILCFFAFAITGQFVHEVIDEDSLRKHMSLKQCQILIQISSIITLILGLWAFILLEQYYFLPFIFMPIGTMYTFRHATASTKGVKDVGILIGNFLLVYFICLIIIQMAGVI
jgi:surface polysaccharide O-acyltransferase-like enzyme